MILKTNDFSYNLLFKDGTEIPIADALSRSPIETTETENINFVDNLDQTPVNKNNWYEFRRHRNQMWFW